MAERPFMQFYGSDFVGDTLHLSAEQIGAYMLLLIAMWNARGQLPNDNKKLARIARLSLHKWRHIWPDLAPMFTVSEHEISHKRVKKEVEKLDTFSQKARANGKLGGEAKALKIKQAPLANATNSPPEKPSIARATPEPEPYREKETVVSKKKASRLPPDWAPSQNDETWLREKWPGVGRELVLTQLAKFRNYWLAKSGKDATKLDWSRTWQNWMMTEQERQGRKPGDNRQPSAADIGRMFIERENDRERETARRADHPPLRQLNAPGQR